MQKMESWQLIQRPLAAGLLAGAVLLFSPLLFANGADAAEDAALLPPSPVPVAEPEASNSAEAGADGEHAVLVLLPDGTTEELSMADYLWSVVAAEMPASFEVDALRAQAVCARTYTLWRQAHPGKHEGADVCTDASCCQAYITRQDAAERWGPLADEYDEKIAGAVADTSGVAVLYGGEPIQAVFFSSSAGATEDAAAVWGSALPYLVSVDSPEGDEVPNYYSTVTLTANEVRELAASSVPGADLAGDPSGWLSDFTYTSSGRVETVKLGGVELSGSAARNLFSLRSACFSVEYGEDGFTFSVTGYGHGVGLSQYGANAMAKAGSTWEEILEHYYTGVVLGSGW